MVRTNNTQKKSSSGAKADAKTATKRTGKASAARKSAAVKTKAASTKRASATKSGTVKRNTAADQKARTQAPQAAVDPSNILGQVAWLMVHSPVHKHMFMTDLEWLALPPIQLNQFRIFRKEGKPVAFASWALLSKEVEQEMYDGRRKLKPHEWRTGDQPWLIDIIAPFGGGEEFLAHLRDEVFRDMELKTIVPGEAPGTTDIVTLKKAS